GQRQSVPRTPAGDGERDADRRRDDHHDRPGHGEPQPAPPALRLFGPDPRDPLLGASPIGLAHELAVAMAAPTIPASLSMAAGTMRARMPVSRGTHLSDCLLTPPPTMIRLGQSTASMCCRYSSTRPAHLPQLRSCSSLARSEARFSASSPCSSTCPNSVLGTRMPLMNSALPIPVPKVSIST